MRVPAGASLESRVSAWLRVAMAAGVVVVGDERPKKFVLTTVTLV